MPKCPRCGVLNPADYRECGCGVGVASAALSAIGIVVVLALAGCSPGAGSLSPGVPAGQLSCHLIGEPPFTCIEIPTVSPDFDDWPPVSLVDFPIDVETKPRTALPPKLGSDRLHRNGRPRGRAEFPLK